MNENQINKIEEILRFGKKMQGTKSDKNSAILKQKLIRNKIQTLDLHI